MTTSFFFDRPLIKSIVALGVFSSMFAVTTLSFGMAWPLSMVISGVIASIGLVAYLTFAYLFPTFSLPKTKDRTEGAFTDDQKAKLAHLLKSAPEQLIVLGDNNVPLKGSDFARFNDNAWFNDEIINFYMGLLPKNHVDKRHVISLNSFFFTLLESRGVKAVLRTSAKNIKSFQDSLILIPVNVSGNHWCLGTIDYNQKTLSYYDSLGGKGKKFFKKIKEFLVEEALRRPELASLNLAEWTEHVPTNIPQQHNIVDCGVFTLLYARALSEHRGFDFNQDDIPYYRRKLALECSNKALMP